MLYVYKENNTKVQNGISYLQKYCGGLDRTMDFKDHTGWTPESIAIMEVELIPRIEAVKETVSKIVQEEELAEIYVQLTEKPVANVKVEPDKEEFVLIDTSTGKQISKGNVEIIKGLLGVMHSMQNENGTLAQVQEKKLPVAEDNGENPF